MITFEELVKPGRKLELQTIRVTSLCLLRAGGFGRVRATDRTRAVRLQKQQKEHCKHDDVRSGGRWDENRP